MPSLARRLALIALLCAIGVAVLALLFYGSTRFNELDARVTANLLAVPDSRTETLAELAADAANALPLLLAIIGVSALALLWRRPLHLLAAGAVVLLANLTTQLMKIMLAHPRVQGELGVDFPIEISYPSGHTTAAFSVGFALWLVAPPSRRVAAGLVGLGYGALVGAGVVVAGWHFVSDVAGAIMVVGFWASLAVASLVMAGLEPSRTAPEGPISRN